MKKFGRYPHHQRFQLLYRLGDESGREAAADASDNPERNDRRGLWYPLDVPVVGDLVAQQHGAEQQREEEREEGGELHLVRRAVRARLEIALVREFSSHQCESGGGVGR